MIDIPTARRLILDTSRPLPAETVPLEEAVGRVLAQDLRADRDMPATDRSAMDGVALRAADARRAGAVLSVAGEVAAGSAARPRLRAGTCVRIYTGAVVPPGADTVVRVEDTETSGDQVTIRIPVRAGAHIRCRGEEATKGTVLLARCTPLGPAQIGLCASVGKVQLKVHRLPRVAVISTGTEVVAPGDPVKPWQIRDANGPALDAALRDTGFAAPKHYRVTDQAGILRRRLRTALAHHDVVLLSGGVSVGRYDLVPEAIAAIGARIRFHGVAVKPGKPLLYATVGRNQHLFGLPGNPLSVLNGFYEFVLPGLHRLAGRRDIDGLPALVLPLAKGRPPRGRRTEYVPVRLVPNAGGSRLAPVAFQGSADLAAAGLADGVAALPRDPDDCRAGSPVPFRPWRRLP